MGIRNTLAGVLVLAVSSAASAVPRGYPVFRAAAPPRIDGRLADACWKAVPWTTGFSALAGGVVSAQTRFAMAWDETNLYVAIRCDEPAMKKALANVRERDGSVWHDDSVEFFATSHKGRRPYYHFAVNTLATRYDEKGQNALWNAEWRAAARTSADRWTVEMALPLEAIELSPEIGAKFRGNVGRARYAGGGTAFSTWTPLVGGFHEPDSFAAFELLGLPGRDADSVAAKMDAPFRAAVASEMREVAARIESLSGALQRAEPFARVREKARAARAELEQTRRAIEQKGFFGAAMDGRLVSGQRLIHRLREIEYLSRIENLFATE